MESPVTTVCQWAYPVTELTLGREREVTVRTTRPLPQSGVEAMGRGVGQVDWDTVMDKADTTAQDTAMQGVLSSLADRYLPTKTLKLRSLDKPFITKELKNIDRIRKREYRKNGKSLKYTKLTFLFKNKCKKAAKNYLDKNVHSLAKSN